MNPTRRDKPTDVELHARWICEELDSSKEVSKDAFVKAFAGNDEKKERSLRAEWYKLQDAILAALQHVNVDVQKDGPSLRCRRLIHRRYMTPNFRRDEAGGGKCHIGNLVAKYLKFDEHSKRSIFLGSGSTIFEVGEAMIEEGPYLPQQLFWTVNIALVSRWCEVNGEGKTPPVRKISIPGGQIEPEYFRFATMKTPGWPAVGIVIIGADGCLVRRDPEDEAARLYLYANSEDTAANTNTFIGLADHALVCCLSADKISKEPRTGPGPEIGLPTKSSVRRILMTDRKPKELQLFRDNRWAVVWHSDQLDELREEQPAITAEEETRRPSPRSFG